MRQSATLFRLAGGALALQTRRVTRDENDTLIEAAITLYHGDRYRMVLARRRWISKTL